MSKRRKLGEKLAGKLEEGIPSPKQVETMFNDVELKEEKKISRKIERKKFGTQLRPELIKQLKEVAVKRDTTITVLLEKIIDEYFNNQNL